MRQRFITACLRVGCAALSLSLMACRIERVRAPDTASPGNEPGPDIPACGISSGSHVGEDGIGVLRIGTSLDAVRANCSVISERGVVNDVPMSVRVDLGRDTASVEFVSGVLSRITLYHQTYRTADSLGVGTGIARLSNLRQATAITERHRLYVVAPAYCGLRFMMMDPAPVKPTPQTGRAALRRLPGESRARELEIVGCLKRR